MLFSVYKNSYDTSGVQVGIIPILERIQLGGRGLDEKTYMARSLAVGDPKTYKAFKEKEFPAVTFAGTFPKNKRKAQYLSEHSGCLVIDIDGLDEFAMPDLLAHFSQMPEVLLAFVSPSGVGIKVVVRVNPVPSDDLEHKGAYHAVKTYFDEFADEFGFVVDTSGKDCSRLCYLAYDPLAIIHSDPPPISWDRDGWLAAESEKQQAFAEASAKPFLGSVDVNALDFIDPNDLDYNQWLSVITACKIAGLSWQQADAWSRRGGVRYTEGEVESRWAGLRLSVSWGAVVNLAKQGGYVASRSRSRLKPKISKSATECLFDTLYKSRDIVRSAFLATARVFGIRSDPGVGKTHQSRGYILDTEKTLLMSTPTTELATEVSYRFSEKMDTFQHHGLMRGYDAIDEADPRERYFPSIIHCIHAPEAEAYRAKGGNMYKVFCSGCHVHADCVKDGYLSQPEQAKMSQAVILPFGQAFTSPVFKHFTSDYLQSYYNKDTRLALIDDVDVVDLFVEVSVSKKRLQAIRDMWGGSVAGDFAADVLRCLEVESDLSKLRDVINFVIGGDLVDDLRDELKSVSLQDGAMSLDDAVLGGYFQRENVSDMPTVCGNWTLFDQLYDCLSHYRRDEDMPMVYAGDTLTFYVRPQLHSEVERLCIMSATLDSRLLKKVFGADTDVYDAPPTEWHKEGRVFQLSTHRAPRRTVYRYEDGAAAGLSATGHRLWSMVEKGIRQYPDKRHALITYKQVLEWLSVEVSELELVTGHYGGMAGLDAKFEECDVFWILFAPFIPPDALKMKARILYGDDDISLCFDRNSDGEFIDERVQAVFEQCVCAELIQAVGRARLVLFGKIVVLLSAIHLFGITDRAVLFDEVDFADADADFGRLAEVVSAREKAQSEAGTDVDKVQDAEGCSERSAYRKTQSARQKDRDVEDASYRSAAEVILSDGTSLTKCAKMLGISRNKLDRILGR